MPCRHLKRNFAAILLEFSFLLHKIQNLLLLLTLNFIWMIQFMKVTNSGIFFNLFGVQSMCFRPFHLESQQNNPMRIESVCEWKKKPSFHKCNQFPLSIFQLNGYYFRSLLDFFLRWVKTVQWRHSNVNYYIRVVGYSDCHKFHELKNWACGFCSIVTSHHASMKVVFA